jgi:hypothetical protein
LWPGFVITTGAPSWVAGSSAAAACAPVAVELDSGGRVGEAPATGTTYSVIDCAG